MEKFDSFEATKKIIHPGDRLSLAQIFAIAIQKNTYIPAYVPVPNWIVNYIAVIFISVKLRPVSGYCFRCLPWVVPHRKKNKRPLNI
jgi:hypothetical protein